VSIDELFISFLNRIIFFVKPQNKYNPSFFFVKLIIQPQNILEVLRR